MYLICIDSEIICTTWSKSDAYRTIQRIRDKIENSVEILNDDGCTVRTTIKLFKKSYYTGFTRILAYVI